MLVRLPEIKNSSRLVRLFRRLDWYYLIFILIMSIRQCPKMWEMTSPMTSPMTVAMTVVMTVFPKHLINYPSMRVQNHREDSAFLGVLEVLWEDPNKVRFPVWVGDLESSRSQCPESPNPCPWV